jgi:hypothetical protein
MSEGTLEASGRRRISEESLHISSFNLVKREPDELLLIKATDAHPLSFRRGKLMLPATMLHYGERPSHAAKRALTAQLTGMEDLEDKFVDLQSYMGSHWDIVFVFEFKTAEGVEVTAKTPYGGAAFYDLASLPKDQIAEDHLEVIEGLKRTQ